MLSNRLRISTFTLTLSAFFIFAGCSKKDDKPTVSPPVKVTVMAVAGSSEANNPEYSGTISSEETVSVSFSVAGTISELSATEGQKVSKGQFLGKLRQGDYQNAYNIAKAQLAEAEDGYARLKKLHDANALPDVKWVEMEQKLKQAQNAAEMAERSLKDAELYSPVSGTISRKIADVGQTVIPVEPIYEIVSTDRLTMNISVSENQIAEFAVGQDAVVKFDNPKLEPVKGKVFQKAVVADPLTRSYTVKISLPSSAGGILPGMLGTAVFEKEQGIDNNEPLEIVLPSQAVLLNEDNRLFVWLVKNGKAERKFVEADELAAKGVKIKSGLQPGDSVIVAGMQKVGTGTEVEAITR